jgi:hypothetical protein
VTRRRPALRPAASTTVVYATVNIFAALEIRQANPIQRDMVTVTNRAENAAVTANGPPFKPYFQ